LSLADFSVQNDHFQFRDDGTIDASMVFPCCVCGFRQLKNTQEPCATCGHNEDDWRKQSGSFPRDVEKSPRGEAGAGDAEPTKEDLVKSRRHLAGLFPIFPEVRK